MGRNNMDLKINFESYDPSMASATNNSPTHVQERDEKKVAVPDCAVIAQPI